MSRGRFVTLEGIEGAGKSTVAAHVRAVLAAAGVTVHLTREPGGTPLAERLRQVVLERGTEALAPVAETLIMFAARSVHVQGVIAPAVARGDWVVSDRFTDATRAYQGNGRGIETALIESLASAVHPGLEPDCTLLLDLPVELGLARARSRSGHQADRFEAETVAFFERVRAGYLDLARAAPRRIKVVDAAQPLDAVRAQVDRILQGLLAR